jgi:CRISPR/Cas system-associated exonuclease Cas4 (RecB family)
MPPILRASDIGTYLYCRRAWWYRKQGVESENRAEMATGTELHRRHGRQVLAAGLLRTLGMVLLLAALILLVVYLTNSFLK